MNSAAKVFFVLAFLSVASGAVSPPFALGAGILFAMLLPHPFQNESGKWAKWLLQGSVVALGFGINFGELLHTGKASVLYTALGISLTMGVGLLLGRLLRVRSKTALLITAGTAICGGSAIAALAPITEPDEEELAVSMGMVFTLNSVALLLFPFVGFALHMTQTQFGLWSALAIHDTSSVIGAAARFGTRALAVGTVVKLTRSLWIIPVALIVAARVRSKARVRLPWFILLFCSAAAAKTCLPGATAVFQEIVRVGHTGMAVTLFVIGTGMTVSAVKNGGARVLSQAVLLWIAVASISLVCIERGWINV